MPQMVGERVSVLAEICRVDAERREVWAPLSTEQIGTDGRVLDYHATVRALQRWAGPEHKDGNMREMHQRKAVGNSVHWEADPQTKTCYLGSKVSRGAQDTWLLIEDGVLRFYSLKGPIWRMEDRYISNGGRTQKVEWVLDYDIEEVSYVDRGGDTGAAPLQILRSADGWRSDVLDSSLQLRAPDELLFRAANRNHDPIEGWHTHPHAGYNADNEPTDPHSHRHQHGQDGKPDADHTPRNGHEHRKDITRLDMPTIVTASIINRAATTKSEDDGNHTASDYAYVPDPEKPSTWKLRIDNKQVVAAAAAALGPKGYRGNKVDIPASDLPKVRAKVRAAWKKFYPDKSEDEMPAGIQRAAHTDIKDITISDSGTHGAATGRHTHMHDDAGAGDGENGQHQHMHEHDSSGDHQHDHANIERIEQQEQRIAQYDQFIAQTTATLRNAFTQRRALYRTIRRQADEESPAEEMSQVESAQQIIGLIADLLASEVGENKTEPDSDQYGAQLLFCAMNDLKSFVVGEGYEIVSRRQEDHVMAMTTEQLATIVQANTAVVERLASALAPVLTVAPGQPANPGAPGQPQQIPDVTQPPVPANPAPQYPQGQPAPEQAPQNPQQPTNPGAPAQQPAMPQQPAQTPVQAPQQPVQPDQPQQQPPAPQGQPGQQVERRDGEDQRLTEALQRALTPMIERIDRIERVTPATAGPVLRTASVPVAKLFPGEATPTDPEQIERGFESFAQQAADPSTRERAQLMAIQQSMRNSMNAAVGKRLESFGAT